MLVYGMLGKAPKAVSDGHVFIYWLSTITANPGLFVVLQGVCQRKGTCGEPEGFSEAQKTAAD